MNEGTYLRSVTQGDISEENVLGDMSQNSEGYLFQESHGVDI